MKKILLLMSLILCVAFKGLAQDKVKISGTVRDDKGEPLVGVQIIPQGATQSGGLTDLDGNFSLMVPKGVKQLNFTYVGFATHKVAINGATTLKVVMHESTSALDEVVVTGYGGKVRRNQVTNSISTVKKEMLSVGGIFKPCSGSFGSCRWGESYTDLR